MTPQRNGLGVPYFAGPLGGGTAPVGNNGLGSFLSYLQNCYANPAAYRHN